MPKTVTADIRAGDGEATAAKIDVTNEAEWINLRRLGHLGEQRRDLGQPGWRR
jgi:hypothetical protein